MRRSPFPRLKLFDELEEWDRLFDMDHFFEPFWKTTMIDVYDKDVVPLVDISEDKDKFEVTADMPGLKKEDIDVSFENHVLSIRAARKEEKDEEKKGWVRKERTYSTFARSIPFAVEVDEENIKASYKDNGVLKVTVPKKEVKKVEDKKRKIEIES